ncbi:recombinase family protein [Streptomyces sp. SA15]|uniref:recombinase family protein n=1 Tax=Streptomyces sp. SA15 TaxID=934019 RepID=UPI0011810542|nr:recombinase family protein [Streptomyces sp. SA15]
MQRLLKELRGVPHGTPSLQEALSFREAGWRLVVVYCRISNDRHRRDGHGVEDQARHCARIAARNRMIVVHRYVDNDKSASKAGVERPDFDAMLDALTNGQTAAGYPIDGVVCVSDDRLYRDVHTYQRFLKCFTAHPARVYAEGLDSYDLYSEEAARRGLLGAAAARAESTKQQHRAKLNHRARAERGEPVASRRPFGWNADKVTLHPGESQVVRSGVQSLLQGKTLTAVTQDFVASGYTSTLGNPWQRQTVKQILRNARICGYRKLHGTLVLDADGMPVVGQWEPIVSPEEWQAVAESLESQRHPGGWRRNGAHRREDSVYLLTGLVRCGRPLVGGQPCGAPLHGRPTTASYEYRCRPALDGGCGRVSRQGPAVDDLITQYVLTALEREGALGTSPAIPWPETHKLETTNQRKALLQEQWYAGEINDREYFSLLAREETEIKRLVNEQQAWLVRHGSVERGRIDARAHWDGLRLREKRQILFRLLEAVVVLPGTKGSHRFEPTAVIPVWRTTVPEIQAA